MEVKRLKRSNIVLIVTVSILAVMLVAFIIMYSMAMSKQNQLKINLENIYQRNFNELVDNVNNSEIKLSKVVVSNYNSYSKKLLNEISKNTSQAATNLSALPVSINGIDNTIKFINQVSGYSQTLANKLDKGEQLTNAEKQTLQDLKNAFSELKDKVNELSKDIYNGNIYAESNKLDGDYNNFTIKLQNVKAGDVEYPTMIYDGPFSDSTINKEIKNLKFTAVSSDVAKKAVTNIFKNFSIDEIEYLGETNGRFETFDYKLIENENSMYVQVTKNGAKLLTLSCMDNNNAQQYTVAQAKDIAMGFTKLAGINDMKCVWSDVVGGDAYLNLAPVQNNVILYPDLVKVKVDLYTGNVVGFEASSYYINHTQRQLQSATISSSQAQELVPSSLQLKETRLALCPLEYNREVLCYELICTNTSNENFYVYVNALTGELENILKTIETDNGNLLI